MVQSDELSKTAILTETDDCYTAGGVTVIIPSRDIYYWICYSEKHFNNINY
jgi:hypothetical protein